MTKNNTNATVKVPELRFLQADGSYFSDWEKKRLGDVGKIVTGSTPPTSNTEYYNGNELFVSPADIKDNRFVVETKTTLTQLGVSKGRKISKAAVLFVCIGSTIGKVAQAGGNCITNQQINSIIAKLNFSNEFIYSLLEFKGCRIKLLAGVQAVPQINKTDFSKLKFHFPSLPEQQKIASFLTAVDQKLAQLDQKKSLLEQYKKGAMQQLFSQELRFKQPDGSDFPDWEEKRLGEISVKIGYGMNSAAVSFDGKNKYIRITDIDEDSRIFNPNPLTSPNGNLHEKYLVCRGDILFTRTGASVGKSYLHQQENGNLYFAGFLIRFSIKIENPYFIYCQTLTSNYRKWVEVMSMRSGQPGINAEEYKSYKLNIPSLPEQQKIATFFSALDTKIETVAQQIATAQTFKKGLLQKMFV